MFLGAVTGRLSGLSTARVPRGACLPALGIRRWPDAKSSAVDDGDRRGTVEGCAVTMATSHPAAAFEIRVAFRVDQVILVVRGDVDVLAAPTLGAVLGALIDQGHQHVVLDCAAITFMDAAGLGVIANSSAHLTTSSRMLTLRAVSPQFRRILDMTGLRDRIRLEASDPNVAVLGAEERLADRPLTVASR